MANAELESRYQEVSRGRIPEWQRFEGLSTFTHIGRNDAAVAFALGLWTQIPERTSDGIRDVVLLGSGPLEPFSIAALPGLEDAQITAVDINQDVIELGEKLKQGASIPLEDIAVICHNPGRPNRDLLEIEKVESGMRKLEHLGSLQNLGKGINGHQVRIPESIGNRVHFVRNDTLSALQSNSFSNPDIIGDFFEHLNIDKDPRLLEEKYTPRVIDEALRSLDSHGLYIIGDTGLHLPKTLDSLSSTTYGILNGASMVHVVQMQENVYITSHYVLASKMPNLFGDTDRASLREKVTELEREFGLSITTTELAGQESISLGEGRVNLAFLKTPSGITVHDVTLPDLKALTPNVGDERSLGVFFPTQK